MLQATQSVLERFANWTEACPCHRNRSNPSRGGRGLMAHQLGDHARCLATEPLRWQQEITSKRWPMQLLLTQLACCACFLLVWKLRTATRCEASRLFPSVAYASTTLPLQLPVCLAFPPAIPHFQKTQACTVLSSSVPHSNTCKVLFEIVRPCRGAAQLDSGESSAGFHLGAENSFLERASTSAMWSGPLRCQQGFRSSLPGFGGVG